MESYNQYGYEPARQQETSGFGSYVLNVFMVMGTGLLLTAGISWLCYRNIMSGGFLYQMLASGSAWMVFVPFILQLVLTITLVAGLRKFSLGVVTVLFYGYAALTGVSFSTIFIAYDIGTISLAFLYTAIMFGACAFAGKVLKVDLSKFRGILFGALTALVVASILALFIPALRDSLLLSYAGVIIFAFYTTYDVQRLKDYYYAGDYEGTEMSRKYGIYGAFQLYLDFINLFLRLLQILGRNRSRN